MSLAPKLIGTVSGKFTGCGVECMFFPIDRQSGIKMYYRDINTRTGTSRARAYRAAKEQERMAALGIAPKVLGFGRVYLSTAIHDKYGNTVQEGWYWGYTTQRAGTPQLGMKNGKPVFDENKAIEQQRTPEYRKFERRASEIGIYDLHAGNYGKIGRKFVAIDIGSDSQKMSHDTIRNMPRAKRRGQLMLEFDRKLLAELGV